MPSKRKRMGNCYDAHFLALLDGKEDGKLCHGQVYSKRLGYHGHCWIEQERHLDVEGHRVEIGTWCKDMANGHDALLPQALYYQAGKIQHVKRYTLEEAAALAVQTGHFGPWD